MDQYENKIKNYYNEEGLLKQYPGKRPLRELALKEIARHFELGKEYSEKEINQVILSHIAFGDIELVRREMFQYRIIGRLKDGSKNWLEWDEKQ